MTLQGINLVDIDASPIGNAGQARRGAVTLTNADILAAITQRATPARRVEAPHFSYGTKWHIMGTWRQWRAGASRGCNSAPQPREDHPTIETTNDGRLILSSTYWGSEHERAGRLFVSVSSGSVRVLVPRSNHAIIEECRPGKYAVLSRGPWPAKGLAEAVEILFEDGTDSPFVLHLSPESFKALPAEPPAGRNWRLALWCYEDDQPRQVLERLCYWRRVPKLPWLKPWEMARSA